MSVMEQTPLTPFPSPTITTSYLQSDTPSEPPTALIQNVGNQFCALRRSASYHGDIAEAVSAIFDTTPIDIKWSGDSHDHITPYDGDNMDQNLSYHLTVNLHPLFERVFLIRNKPRTISGNTTNLQCGAHIHNNIDDYSWKIGGIYFPTQGKIAIYRAYNDSQPSSIFIVSPIEWSIEGLQFFK